MVPLGDVGQHTLPCSVIGQCRVSRADGHQNSTPGVGERWGRSHVNGCQLRHQHGGEPGTGRKSGHAVPAVAGPAHAGGAVGSKPGI